MKTKKMILLSGLFLVIEGASGQSILQQYFNGNKDSMLQEATKLINLPSPVFRNLRPASPDSAADQPYKSTDFYFKARDQKNLYARKFAKASRNTIILIHGVGTDGLQYNTTAGLLRAATGAEVYALDLRGHGKSAGNDGDVDYIGQYADDVEDLVNVIRQKKPGGKIMVAGHSMGGGVALQYALHPQSATIDGFILFAPLIGQNTPAIRQPQSPANDTTEPFMQIAFARIIGLKMLNELNDHSQDSLPVLFLNLPVTARGRMYTYRANMSGAPEAYTTGLEALGKPTLVLTGTADEVFDAALLKKAFNEHSKAVVHLIAGASHNGVRMDPVAFDHIKKWFAAL